ncbi:DUF5681 domain-containing protein [Sulfitobacter sp. HNIBRBA3233]|uniref:DUF5681 domain-containing protein n=1 Tax=Sulfitobacter marinivivus TaxID=3158558 RepID=UPI0032DF2943
MSKKDEPEYEVGYGKPPTASRFQKGKSGNPKGRPKGAKGLIASLNRELEAKIMVREGDHSVYISKAEAGAKRLVELALKGDMAALRMLVTIDSSFVGSADSTKMDQPMGTTLDKTDEAVLAHFTAQIRKESGGSGDDGGAGP